MIGWMIYLIGGLVLFLGSIPFVLNQSQDAMDCILITTIMLMAATMWPLTLPILAIVALGKWTRSF